jgi:hypothetical protein
MWDFAYLYANEPRVAKLGPVDPDFDMKGFTDEL